MRIIETAVQLDMNIIPDDWFIYFLGESVTPIQYKGEQHKHLSWRCELQHRNGGKLTSAIGTSPNEALTNCVNNVEKGYTENRWHN